MAIGRTLFYWTDARRDETITADPNDKRRLFVQLWYPAKKSTKVPAAEYFPNSDLMDDPGFAARLRALRTHAVPDAKPAKLDKKLPLIVFSPGLGSSPFSYTTIIESLVSHGYVVAAINHPYDSGPFKFNDGTAIKFASDKWDREAPKDWTADERKKFMDDRRLGWAADASFVVDQLQHLDSGVSKNIDFTRLGMLGHSYGGQAASIVCASDERFKACANLDGLAQGNAVLPDAAGKTMKQPFLFFTKAAEVTDSELALMGMTRSDYRARERRRLVEKWKPSFRKQIEGIEAGGFLLIFPGITHGTFSDSPLIDAKSSQPYSDRSATANVINEYVLAFFDKYLKLQPAPLLDRPEPAGSVIVEHLKK
jgi:predicted dienelactone hydrolase